MSIKKVSNYYTLWFHLLSTNRFWKTLNFTSFRQRRASNSNEFCQFGWIWFNLN